MSAPEITFEELERIFWTSEAPDAFVNRRARAFQAAFVRKVALPDLINLPESFYTNEYHHPGYLPIPYETAMFTLTSREFGAATFVAVVAGDWVIVPPFPFDDLADRLSRNPFEDRRP